MFCLEIKYSARINFFNSRVLQEKSGLFFSNLKVLFTYLEFFGRLLEFFYLVEFSADVKNF